jgi:endonuclease YncB( thermonuclease family)
LNGIDTPELHPGLNVPNRDNIIERANKAKNYLKEEIQDKILFIEITGEDKYGRLLGTLYYQGDDDSINDKMIKLGYAVSYNGGTKQQQ